MYGQKNKEKHKKGIAFSFYIDYNIDNKRKEVIEMTKTEMVNRMIILGCIKEEDRNRWMRKTTDELTKVYIRVIPMRLEHLGRI